MRTVSWYHEDTSHKAWGDMPIKNQDIRKQAWGHLTFCNNVLKDTGKDVNRCVWNVERAACNAVLIATPDSECIGRKNFQNAVSQNAWTRRKYMRHMNCTSEISRGCLGIGSSTWFSFRRRIILLVKWISPGNLRAMLTASGGGNGLSGMVTREVWSADSHLPLLNKLSCRYMCKIA